MWAFSSDIVEKVKSQGRPSAGRGQGQAGHAVRTGALGSDSWPGARGPGRNTGRFAPCSRVDVCDQAREGHTCLVPLFSSYTEVCPRFEYFLFDLSGRVG